MVLKKITNKLFILNQKKALQLELERFENQYKISRQIPEYGTSEDDNIQEVEKIQEKLSLQRSLKQLIKGSKDALKRIEKGTYGICESCGGPIETGRLKIYAAASLCASCSARKFKK